MPVKTGRTEANAEVVINYKECIVCGLCVRVCKGGPIYIKDDKVQIDQNKLFGCLGCAHCVLICPVGCINVQGRELSAQDIIELPPQSSRATYEQLKSLMLSRRSIREFKDKEVDREVIEKIIEAASTSPMGIPPSDVEILVLDNRAKVTEFGNDIVNFIKSIKWLFSPGMLLLMRPFMGKEAYEATKTFIVPIFEAFIEQKEKGVDWLLYNAPLAMYFHTSPYADPADPLITATYAMLAAESLGLGSCLIGTVGPLLKYSKKLKQKYGIPIKNQQGIMLIIGYPDVKFQRAVKRSFARINYY